MFTHLFTNTDVLVAISDHILFIIVENPSQSASYLSKEIYTSIIFNCNKVPFEPSSKYLCLQSVFYMEEYSIIFKGFSIVIYTCSSKQFVLFTYCTVMCFHF